MVEQSIVLRTKAMRERQNQRELRKYRFTFIRVRFSDGLTLQGTFKLGEKLDAVKEFIREYLTNEWRPFFLSPSGGKKVSSVLPYTFLFCIEKLIYYLIGYF